MLRRTSFGLHMRAVTQNRDMAAVMGIPHRAGRRADLRPRLGHRRDRPGWRCRRSAMSAPISARSTSSTASWSSCSAASAVCSARWSARMSLGIVNKISRAGRRRGARQGRRAGGDHPLHPEAAARPLRAQGAAPRRGGHGRWPPLTSTARLELVPRGCRLVLLLGCRCSTTLPPAGSALRVPIISCRSSANMPATRSWR